MATGALFSLIFRIALMAALGYIMRRRGMMDDEFQKKLSNILLQVIIPFSAIAAGNSNYDKQLGGNLLRTAGVVVIYYVLAVALMFFIHRSHRVPGKKNDIMFTLVVLGNTGYIGMPILQELYGAEGLLYAVIFNLGFQFVAFTVGVKVLGGQLSLRRFFGSVMTLAPLVAILIFVSPFRLPAFMVSAFEQVGSLSAPFSMFITGSALAKIRLRELVTDKLAWMVNALRMFVFPLAMAGALYAAGFSGIMPAALVVLTGMPPATLNVIFAEQYDSDMPFTTRCVVQGTTLMMLTLPLCILMNQQLFL